MNERIENHVELAAPISRVWRALTDHREFGQWFGVKLEGPFVAGKLSSGQVTHPGYEHLKWQATVKTMEPEKNFSFTWPQPESIEPGKYSGDYSKDPTTLVEFRLEKTKTGTRLTVTEAGFEKLPDNRRDEAFRRNEGGWNQQMKNIKNYLAQKP